MRQEREVTKDVIRREEEEQYGGKRGGEGRERGEC